MKRVISYMQYEYENHRKHRDEQKVRICEEILGVLYKQVVMPVLDKYYVKGKCYRCHSLNQEGDYCSNCGQRLK